jgi:hypothetical protein
MLQVRDFRTSILKPASFSLSAGEAIAVRGPGAGKATERVERRLAAILAADVAGYSRLMGADEEGTHERLKEHLQTLVSLLYQKGRESATILRRAASAAACGPAGRRCSARSMSCCARRCRPWPFRTTTRRNSPHSRRRWRWRRFRGRRPCAPAANASFFTLSKRKGLPHLPRLKTARSTISR